MSSFISMNNKSQKKIDKLSNYFSTSILDYDFLNPNRNEPQSTVDVSKGDIAMSRISTNQYIPKKSTKDKSFSITTNGYHKNDSMYYQSKKKAELFQMKLNTQRIIKKEEELKEMKPYCIVNPVSRNLHAKRLEKSKTLDVPLYQRQKEKIKEKNTINLKQLIIKEAFDNNNKTQRTFVRKDFNHWIKKNEQWKKNTVNKTKVKMIELEEEAEQYIFKPKINEKSRNINRTKNSSLTSNHSLLTTTPTLRSCKSISNIRKEYYKIQSIPSFKPITNTNHTYFAQKCPTISNRKDSSLSTMSSNKSKRPSNKGILLQIHSMPSKIIRIDDNKPKIQIAKPPSIKNKNLKNNLSIELTAQQSHNNTPSDSLYSLNIRDQMPNQLSMNVVVYNGK